MSSLSKSYFSDDNIFALASPLGGAICILRISGFGLKKILKSLGVTPAIGHGLEVRKMLRVKLVSPVSASPIDDAMITYFENPRSYTGEEVVEFFLHGSVAIAGELMESLRFLGCRQALPGEFSFRAVRNGKLTVTQAQAVAELIAAKNTEAVTIAIEKLEGTQQKFVAEIAEELRNLAVFGELAIDFSDQDVPEVSLPRLKKRLEVLLEKMTRLKSSFARGRFIQDGVRVAILGLPNAGKSSFFNQIIGEDRSIVSVQPGTTRDVIRETLTLKGSEGKSVTLRIEDTAGVRDAIDEVEKIGVERSLKAAKDADIVILLKESHKSSGVENASDWKEFKIKLHQAIPLTALNTSGNLLLVSTKMDLYENGGAENLQGMEEFNHRFRVSNLTGEGIQSVIHRLVELSLKKMEREIGEVILTRLDHYESVVSTIEHIDRALGAPAEDLFAADIRHALMSLGPVIGDTLPDDILGKIFSEFCIGK